MADQLSSRAGDPREVLEAVRVKLEQGSASRADHHAALEAIVALEDSEAAAEWLRRINDGFGVAYAHQPQDRVDGTGKQHE